jgi:hypothetical protein
VPLAVVAGSLSLADVDGDGDLDLLPAAPQEQELNVFMNQTAAPTSGDRDGDGSPDECARPLFHRGDASGDGELDVSDGLCLLQLLFLAQGELPCLEAADANNDGQVDCSDAVFLLGYLFMGTPPPPAPGPPGLPCGPDPDPPGSAGRLSCWSYPPCALAARP